MVESWTDVRVIQERPEMKREGYTTFEESAFFLPFTCYFPCVVHGDLKINYLNSYNIVVLCHLGSVLAVHSFLKFAVRSVAVHLCDG